MDIFEQIAELREEVGMKKGMEKASHLIARKLLKESNLSMRKIASLTNVPYSLIRKIKETLK